MMSLWSAWMATDSESKQRGRTKLRGLRWNNKRPNLVVVDDLENDEAVVNRDRREKLKRWFNGALLPCLSDTGIVRVVGTILHLDSLLESLMPENQLNTTNKQKFLVQKNSKNIQITELLGSLKVQST